jgi:hypothetical protein
VGFHGQRLRSPREVPHHLLIPVERTAVSAVVPIVGSDRSKSAERSVGKILVLDTYTVLATGTIWGLHHQL